MRLLSKYKESYDAMLATGVGDLTWVRKPELAKLPDSLVPHCISKSKSLNLEIGQGTEMTGYFILGKKGYPFVAHCLPTPCKDDLRNLTQQALSGEWTFLFSALACKRYCQDKKLKGARETYLRNAHDWAAITLNESELDSPIGLVFWGANVSSPIRTAIYIKDMVLYQCGVRYCWIFCCGMVRNGIIQHHTVQYHTTSFTLFHASVFYQIIIPESYHPALS